MPYYPEIEPYVSGLLDVGDGQRLYWEVCGNPAGKPAVFLHGGPGGGCVPGHRRMFDPERYRVVLFDQRNCGRSLPHAADLDTDLAANTTEHLVADIERLREQLGVDRWLVWGGSWGTTLAFAYAERHPDRVSELVLVAITNTTRAEIDWLYGGLGRFFPVEWERYRALVGARPDVTGTELVTAYDALLQGDDQPTRERAAIEWCAWEDAVLALDAGGPPGLGDDDLRTQLAFARICAHYFSRHGFLADGELQRNAAALRDIPGVMVHGRLDLTAPLHTAWRMARLWPQARLEVIDGAGHTSGPGLGDAIVAALDGFAPAAPDPPAEPATMTP
jgi:proline iminopeptidase